MADTTNRRPERCEADDCKTDADNPDDRRLATAQPDKREVDAQNDAEEETNRKPEREYAGDGAADVGRKDQKPQGVRGELHEQQSKHARFQPQDNDAWGKR